MKHKILMTLALLLTAVGGAWAQTQWESGDCTVTLNNGTLTVSGNGAMADYINSSDRPWDGNRNDITSVVVESGVTSVRRNAFESFTNLTSVTLPEGLTAIGLYAFSNCSSLQSITIPSTVTSIGDGAFDGCSAMTSVTLPEGLTAIGASAFGSCSSLTSITIPSTVTSIGNYAFMKSKAISDVNLYANPDNLTWGNTSLDFKQSKATQCHVLAEHLSTYQNKFSSANVTFVGDLKPLATSDVEVTTNAASKQDLFTEAWFTMPANDVTVNYTLVRDMNDATSPVTFSGIPADGKIFVKKGDDGKYQPAEALNIQLIDPLAATDAQNIIGSSDITIKVLKGDDSTGPVEYDQENPITLDAFLADMKPGFYWIKAEGTTDGAYDGTVYSTEMWLTEAYNLMLNTNPEKLDKVSFTVGGTATTVSKENPIIKNVETGKSVKLSVSEGYMFSDMFTGYKVNFTPAGDALAWTKVGCYYWGDYGNNNIFNPVQWPGVEMQKNGNSWETTINVNGLTNIIFNDFQTNNQQTSDLPFASGAADNLGSYTIADAVEMTYNNAKTEATFSMPASNVGMNFNVKRNLSVKTAAEMAERIRINKTGDTYSPIQMTDVQPTVTNNLDAQNPVVLEFGKDYSTTLQKKGEGQDEWIDTQDYGVGTYRLMVTGNGEYGGTCYTNEFELYAGYEVTVAAGEYATFYGKEAVVVEGEDAELYTISSVSDTEAVLSDKLAMVAANTPMLVYNKGEETKTFLLIPTEDQADEVTVAKEFKGSLTEGEIPASSAVTDYYALNGKAFVWVKYAIEIGANKCWLQIGDQPAAARAMTRSIVGGGDTTNMDDVRWQMEDGNYYDLQGRKVEKPNRKGIYIHNGQKVIVR